MNQTYNPNGATASQAAAQLFSSISTAASSVATTFQVIGNASEVLAIKSQDWVNATREKSMLDAMDRTERLRDEAAFTMANRIGEHAKVLANNPALAQAYEVCLNRINAKLDGTPVSSTTGTITASP